MSEVRKKAPQVTGPRGPLRYPKLKEPDFGNETFPKPDGEYSTQQVFKADSAEAKSLIKQLTPLYKEAMAEASQLFKAMPIGSRKTLEKKGVKAPVENPLFTELYDKETEQPTGEISFKFAMPAAGEVKSGPRKGKKWTAKPVIFDAKGKRMNVVPDIWGGTVAKIAFEARPYFIPGSGAAGLKLKLVGVQVIELVAGGERSAKDLGFGEEEGYEHSETEGPFEDESADKSTDDDGSGDF